MTCMNMAYLLVGPLFHFHASEVTEAVKGVEAQNQP
jgi:hypothetical protein